MTTTETMKTEDPWYAATVRSIISAQAGTPGERMLAATLAVYTEKNLCGPDDDIIVAARMVARIVGVTDAATIRLLADKAEEAQAAAQALAVKSNHDAADADRAWQSAAYEAQREMRAAAEAVACKCCRWSTDAADGIDVPKDVKDKLTALEDELCARLADFASATGRNRSDCKSWVDWYSALNNALPE